MINCEFNVSPEEASSNTSPFSHKTASKLSRICIHNLTLTVFSAINTKHVFLFRILFIIWNNIVRAYSAQTGEWIRDLEGATENIVGIQLDVHNHKIVFACTTTGQIVSWKWKSGVVNENIVSYDGFFFVCCDKKLKTVLCFILFAANKFSEQQCVGSNVSLHRFGR